MHVLRSIPNPQRASIMVDHVNDIFEQIKALQTSLNPEALKASAKEVVVDYASRLWVSSPQTPFITPLTMHCTSTPIL